MASPPTPGASNLIRAACRGDLMLIKGFSKVVERQGEEPGKVLVQVADKSGRTLLHYAVAAGRTHVCKYLIETLKFDIHIKDDAGDTPLHMAAVEGQYITSAYLLDKGANPNTAGLKGMTALHCAAEKGRVDQLRLLISKGAEVNAESFKGTPLQCAAASKMKDAVKILLKHGANPNSVSHQIYSPLMAAILEGSVDCVRLLLKHKADPNFESHHLTPLIVAASEGEIEIIKSLLKAGANPNATNLYDHTPIEIAALRGSRAFVTALFPYTTRIAKFPIWIIDGILGYVYSEEAVNQRALIVEKKFLEVKALGAEAVKKSDYLDAVFWYTEAHNVKPMDAAVLSNRSLCWTRMNEGKLALEDAESCIRLRRDWPKGYYRKGAACRIIKDFKEAAKAFLKGLKLDPRSKELQDAYRDTMAELGEPMNGDLDSLLNEVCIADNEDDEDECMLCSMFNVDGGRYQL